MTFKDMKLFAGITFSLALVLSGVAGCKTPSDPASSAKGLGGDADGNKDGKTYLYTVADTFVVQWLCPSMRPILRSNCRQVGSPRSYDSFKQELRQFIEQDIAKANADIAQYQIRIQALTNAISAGGPDTADLSVQRDHNVTAVSDLRLKVVSLETEKTHFDDTLAKLNSDSIDYEINEGDLLYRNNRGSFQRFQDVIARSDKVIDCTDMLTGLVLCLNTEHIAEWQRKRCDDGCVAKLRQLVLIFDHLRENMPRAVGKYVVGEKLGALAKDAASAIRDTNWTGFTNDTLLLEMLESSNSACDDLIALQAAAPSVTQKVTACKKNVTYR